MADVELKQIQEAVTELRTIVESKDADSAASKEKLDNLNKFLDAQEAKNQELTTQVLEAKKAQDEMKDHYEAMEKKLCRLSSSDRKEIKEEVKAFEKWMVKGLRGMEAEEVKALRTNDNTQGGYLAPVDFRAEIIKNITEISPVRSVARVLGTSREAIVLPTRTSLPTANWACECEDTTASNSNYGSNEIKVNRLTSVCEVTVEMLGDSAVNIVNEINRDISEQFAATEGAAFINGDGVAKPEGVLTNANVTILDSGEADTYDGDDLIDMTGQLKTGYNPTWGLNRLELAFIRKLKDGNGQYLWNPGLAAGQPNSILGLPYVEMPDMPNQGAGLTPIILGDWGRGYVVVDHTDMLMVRDDFTVQNQGKVRFIVHRRVGGQVVLSEAFVKLRCQI